MNAHYGNGKSIDRVQIYLFLHLNTIFRFYAIHEASSLAKCSVINSLYIDQTQNIYIDVTK